MLAHSIWRNASRPVRVSLLRREQLPINRERDRLASTDFADTRFLCPFLCDYQGWSIFMDCDMLCTGDIVKLWEMQDDAFAVMVRKHNHVPRTETKFLGAAQTKYPKKNWSSLMMFNNARCKTLTPAYLESTAGLDLHQFKWLESDDEIGEVPKGWNLLVGYEDWPGAGLPPLIHYTEGGPYFREYQDCDYAEPWRRYHEDMSRAGHGPYRP